MLLRFCRSMLPLRAKDVSMLPLRAPTSLSFLAYAFSFTPAAVSAPPCCVEMSPPSSRSASFHLRTKSASSVWNRAESGSSTGGRWSSCCACSVLAFTESVLNRSSRKGRSGSFHRSVFSAAPRGLLPPPRDPTFFCSSCCFNAPGGSFCAPTAARPAPAKLFAPDNAPPPDASGLVSMPAEKLIAPTSEDPKAPGPADVAGCSSP
mmetsp:Transcript_4494/g.10976  ORF Transcript_4494/g.10976 Transcript_4494/m.10976 type:complete len:206 (-) Transcript_4494:427-1044(-)